MANTNLIPLPKWSLDNPSCCESNSGESLYKNPYFCTIVRFSLKVKLNKKTEQQDFNNVFKRKSVNVPVPLEPLHTLTSYK